MCLLTSKAHDVLMGKKCRTGCSQGISSVGLNCAIVHAANMSFAFERPNQASQQPLYSCTCVAPEIWPWLHGAWHILVRSETLEHSQVMYGTYMLSRVSQMIMGLCSVGHPNTYLDNRSIIDIYIISKNG